MLEASVLSFFFLPAVCPPWRFGHSHSVWIFIFHGVRLFSRTKCVPPKRTKPLSAKASNPREMKRNCPCFLAVSLTVRHCNSSSSFIFHGVRAYSRSKLCAPKRTKPLSAKASNPREMKRNCPCFLAVSLTVRHCNSSSSFIFHGVRAYSRSKLCAPKTTKPLSAKASNLFVLFL